MRKTTSRPLESDPARGLWFWQHTAEDGHFVEFGNRPHPALPHRCVIHDWYSSERCRATHERRRPGLAKTSKPGTETAPRRRTARS